MIQSNEEIEEHYNIPDPWGYQSNPDDIFRKQRILEACKAFVPYGLSVNDGPYIDISLETFEKELGSAIPSLGSAFVHTSKRSMGKFGTVLDIGAGEGWITQDLPAVIKYGYEVSEQAKFRFPETVIPCRYPLGSYDLVVATGVLYRHYDVSKMFELMKLASRIVVTCNIESWEVSEMSDPHFTGVEMGWMMLMEQRFKYREFIQKLRVFKVK